MTADVRRTPRRGTPSACATKRTRPTQAREIVACARGRRPSLGPSTRACQSSLCSAAQAPEVRRSSEHHGWATSGNRDEPSLGLSRTDVARLAACHRFRKEEAWHVEEKEGDRGLRPCEDCKSPGLVARTSNTQLQKSIGDVWPRISSANALQKERQGRVNRGLARSEGRRVIPPACASSEGYSRESVSPL
jgi:hypothetical protein